MIFIYTFLIVSEYPRVNVADTSFEYSFVITSIDMICDRNRHSKNKWQHSIQVPTLTIMSV